MPADEMDRWYKSGLAAVLNGRAYRPTQHPYLKGCAMSIQRGQSDVFLLSAEDGTRWMLKKFHAGKALDRDYLERVGSVLPRHQSFIAGTQRSVLSANAIRRGKGHHYNKTLNQWLEGTILMPAVEGMGWSAVADDLRDGNIDMGPAERVTLCRSFSEVILLLEQHECAHRDISCGNVFFCMATFTASAIDFDSLYHPSLAMPRATTCGTHGYTAPYSWRNGFLDASASWCPHADRYSLAILNTELMVLGKGTPIVAEGGIFSQDDLRARSGQTIDRALGALNGAFPSAAGLLRAALNSQGFDQCPSPEDWLNFCQSVPGVGHKPPSLAELEEVEEDFFVNLLRRQRPPAPLWPSPSLDEMPLVDLRQPWPVPIPVSLPPNPWENES